MTKNIKEHKVERTKLKNKIAKCREKLKNYEISLPDMTDKVGESTSDVKSDVIDSEAQQFEIVNNEEVTADVITTSFANKVSYFNIYK